MMGLRSYAEKQASTLLGLARDCARQWIPALANEGIVPDWVIRYNALLTENTQGASVATDMDTDMQGDDKDDECEHIDGPEDIGDDDTRSVDSTLDSEVFDLYDLEE